MAKYSKETLSTIQLKEKELFTQIIKKQYMDFGETMF